MSSAFQNRLVGTMVVVALSVTFLPDLLDGKKEQRREVFPMIPPHPAFESVAVSEDAFNTIETEPKQVLEADDILPQEVVPVTAGQKTKVVKVKSKQKKVKKEELQKFKKLDHHSSWTLQVGTFKNGNNAEKLIAKLRLNGFKAYSVPSKIIDGRLTKIFVGPSVKRNELEALQEKVKKITQSKSVVLKFDPLHSL